MLEYYHAPASFVDPVRGITLSVFLPDEHRVFEQVILNASVGVKGAVLRMLPEDGVIAQESYTLYSVRLPHDLLSAGERLEYYFSCNGAQSERFCVPIKAAAPIPALILSEIWPRTRRFACIKLQNTTKQPIDLYDFELLLKHPKKGVFRNPLAGICGENILPAGKTCLLRFLSPSVKNTKGFAAGQAAFSSSLEWHFPGGTGELAEGTVLFFDVDVCQETTPATLKEDCFDLQQTPHDAVFSIVPRGKDATEAIFSIGAREGNGRFGLPYRRAYIWDVDLDNPQHGILYDDFAVPLADACDPRGCMLDSEEDRPPAILPILPREKLIFGRSRVRVVFAAIGENVGFTKVYFRDRSGAYHGVCASLNNDGYYEASAPRDLAFDPESFSYYISMRSGGYSVEYGSAARPITLAVEDRAGPVIRECYPASGQVLEADSSTDFFVHFSDASGVDTARSGVCLDGRAIAKGLRWEDGYLQYTLERVPERGEHLLEITLRDTCGNRTYQRVCFSVASAGRLKRYIGQIHSHTGDSDGVGTVEQAMLCARENGADFFAVTEHGQQTPPEVYAEQIAVADRFCVDGAFATLYGFEMTWDAATGFWGHMNLLGASRNLGTDVAKVPLPTFYERIKAEHGVIAMFNHPSDAWGDFADFGYRDEEIVKKIGLIEINGSRYDQKYARALARGWKVSPLFNEDNHGYDWMIASNGAGCVLAHALTRENIMDALCRGRTYSTTDRRMRVNFRINGAWLGSELHAPEKLKVELDVSTEAEAGIGVLELVTEDNIVAARLDVGALKAFRWEIELDPDFDYYYARICNANAYTVTAPVYVRGRDLLGISALTLGRSEATETPHAAKITLQSFATKPITDIRADLYLVPEKGFELRTVLPYTSITLDRLEPGECYALNAAFADVPGKRRLCAVVSGMIGKKRYADTASVSLSSLFINKLLPISTPTVKENTEICDPFAYLELYNPTDTAVLLAGKKLAAWRKYGKGPDPQHTYTFTEGKIPAHSALTLWCRPADRGLTCADFNTRYGTSLIESEDLLILDAPLFGPCDLGGRIDLRDGDDLLSRVTYGKYCRAQNEERPDEPILFAPCGEGVRAERELARQDAAVPPGKVLPEQKLPLLEVALKPGEQREETDGKKKRSLLTRLSRAPLVPFEATALVANALVAVKNLFKEEP